MNRHDRRQILDENDPINHLSLPELELLEKKLKFTKEKAARKISTMVRKVGITQQDQELANAAYMEVCKQLRTVEARLKSLNT